MYWSKPYGAISGAKTASTTNTAVIAAPTHNSHFENP
jgi:hypothetical protein